MSEAGGVTRALGAFRRRAMLVAFVRAATVGLVLALLVMEIVALLPVYWHSHLLSLSLVVMAAAFTVAALYARRCLPTALNAARRVDHIDRLHDLIVTALECETRADDISVAITRTACASLSTSHVARMLPFEMPRQWRRWTALIAVAQVAAIAFAWRPPGARALPASGSALSMPGSADAASAATPASPAPGSASAASPSAPTPTVPLIAAAATTANTAEASSANAEPAAAGTPRSTAVVGEQLLESAGATPETLNGPNRYRQAAAHASDVVAQGRVPAALRGVVERYFAAIRTQGK